MDSTESRTIAGDTEPTSAFRTHGDKPYHVVVIHGGPGTPGSMGYVAKRLSDRFGVMEPFQTARTITGQVEELSSVIRTECGASSVELVGHSWGAWLSFILAAKHPALVDKVIMVGAGAFEDRYNAELARTRLDRLSRTESAEVLRLNDSLINGAASDTVFPDLRRFGELMSKTDSYDCLEIDDSPMNFQPDIYRSIWREAGELRSSGELLDLGRMIACPVVAIHGDYDPHPAAGVRESLAGVLNNFRFILLPRCGHYPWKERYAGDDFFKTITKELQGTQ